jgi:hypothetical protein
MKRIFLIVLAFLLTVSVVTSASARDLPYYFQVENQVVNVYWNADFADAGSADKNGLKENADDADAGNADKNGTRMTRKQAARIKTD